MNNKVCLLVLYNHNYESNISRIEKIYKGRFKYIYHIMPFYTGNKKNVIPVYESSFQFSGYITQAYSVLKNLKTKFSHFCIVADDIILNPQLNDTNFLEKLNLDEKSGYINTLYPLTKENLFKGKSYWIWSYSILIHFLKQANACEFLKHIPTFEQAVQHFKEKGLPLDNMPSKKDFDLASEYVELDDSCYYKWNVKATFEQCLLRQLKRKRKIQYLLSKLFKNKIKYKKDNPIYPLVYGYSDFIIIPNSSMKQFCHLCGVFAAARIFVESAIPTSMVLTIPKLKKFEDTKFKKYTNQHSNEERDELVNAYGKSLDTLFKKFPKDCLFLHPIKLSQWREK